jgi:predicted  nucleic acid-binding Zn-ribbon protein
MKLLLCIDCGDIFKLSPKREKSCDCGKTKGKYLNERDVEISGNCMPIGFANSQFGTAVRTQRMLDEEMSRTYKDRKINTDGMGVRFEAFVIPSYSKSIIRK